MTKLFAYGTLNAPGVRQRLFGETPEPTNVTLPDYDMGMFLAPFGVRFIVPKPGYDTYGLLWEIPDQHLRRVDQYEGDGYERFMATVYDDNNTPHRAWAYRLKGTYPGVSQWELEDALKEVGIVTLG